MPIISAAQAGHIVKNLSDEQLLQKYHNPGTFPLFVIFSEMQERMQTRNSQNKIPTETVAERIAGGNEPEGIAGLQQEVRQPPRQMYEGGPTDESTLTFGFSEDLPSEARKIIAARRREMKKLEKPDYIPPQYAATGDLIEAPPPASRKDFGGNGSVSPQYIYNSLVRDYGYSPHAAAAIAGNVMHESVGDPRSVQRGAKVPGRGLAQWSPERYNSMIAFSKERGLDPNSADTQIAFIDNELKGSEAGSGKRLSSAQNLQEAHNAFLGYLRPKFYSSNNPSRTIAYNDRYNKSADVLGVGSLPTESKPEGTDLRDERAFGYDPAFGGRDATPSPYQYDRRSPLLDPSRMPSTSSIDKGLAALKAAQTIQGVRFAEGGAVYLAGGNDGKSLRDQEAQNKIRQFAQIQQAITGKQEPIYNINPPESQDYPISEDESERIQREYETSIPGLSAQKPQSPLAQLERAQEKTKTGAYLSTEDGTSMEPTSSPAGRFFSGIGSGIGSFVNRMSPDVSKSPRILELQRKRDALQIGPFTQETDAQRFERLNKIDEIDRQIDAVMNEKPPSTDYEDPRVVSSGQGIPSAKERDDADTSGFGMTDWRSAVSGVPGSTPRGTTPPGRPKPPGADKGVDGAGGAGGGARGDAGAGGAGGDGSFRGIFDQVKAAIGSEIPNEMKEQMKQRSESLASMKNDKIVEAAFAAAKTLAGQRKGSVNFADAVANAGLAAQEVQKRIYKADDDMRKYRMEALKLEQEGKKTAATQAMNYSIAAEHNRTTLASAAMQLNRMIAAQEASERRTNISSVYGNINKLESLIQGLAKPGSVEYDPQKTEAERRRLMADLQAAKSQLFYYQTGHLPEEVKAEMDRRKAEAAAQRPTS